MAHSNPIYKGIPEKFWVVTKCYSKKSELVDILFESSIPGMIRQHLGGLRFEDVLGIYSEKSKAEAHAKRVLKFNLQSSNDDEE